MLYFCTLFDSCYLSRGLAMYDSLRANCASFHIYIFAFDKLSFQILNDLHPERATIISLEKFENKQLLDVKKDRTRAEYCWTCTSSTIEYVLANFNVPACTYIDADLYFYRSPEILLEVLNQEKTVLITEHRYSWLSRIYEEKRAGKFCVQFITFVNEPKSRMILKLWISQCINWCYARYENGKFGDQKYLDEWPVRYNNVKISEHPGAGVAPWNILQYRIFRSSDSLMGIEKRTGKEFDIIFFHFHFVRFMDNWTVDIGWNRIPGDILKCLYIPYINKIKEIENNLEKRFEGYKTRFYPTQPSGIKDYVKYIIKKISGFNIIKT
jgi:hypothetical protein